MSERDWELVRSACRNMDGHGGPLYEPALTRLQRERDALREALGRIAAFDGDYNRRVRKLGLIARAALTSKQETTETCPSALPDGKSGCRSTADCNATSGCNIFHDSPKEDDDA